MLRISLQNSHSPICIFTRSHKKMWVSYVTGTTKMSQILAIANTKKIPGCYISRCYVGSCGGNIVSGVRAGVTGEACTYVYLYWFTFIIVRPAQWQPRKNDPLDY